MTAMRLASGMRSACALALVAALLCAVPAAAEPAESTSTPSPSATSTAPATGGEVLRTPPSKEETSPIEIPTDPETARFRKELARRQARLDEFMAQLDVLDRELAVAAEAYNQAVERLESTREKVATTEANLEDARFAYETQLDILNGRANAIYRDGAFGVMEVLLESKSVRDFVARVKFLNTIGLADAEVAKALNAQKEFVERKAEDLKAAEQQAAALEFELKARQIEVMLRIQERQEMLASAQVDLLELLDAEAARRQREEADLLRQILSGADRAGIVIETGSPVETAFAYYGVPYLWAGESPAGFDCSGLIMYVFRQHGVELPHYSGSQFLLGEKIPPAGLQPGDVVFFGSPVYHVGMYAGGGYFLHAPRTGDFVKISPLAARSDYSGARRYDWSPRIGPPLGSAATAFDPLAALR